MNEKDNLDESIKIQSNFRRRKTNINRGNSKKKTEEIKEELLEEEEEEEEGFEEEEEEGEEEEEKSEPHSYPRRKTNIKKGEDKLPSKGPTKTESKKIVEKDTNTEDDSKNNTNQDNNDIKKDDEVKRDEEKEDKDKEDKELDSDRNHNINQVETSKRNNPTRRPDESVIYADDDSENIPIPEIDLDSINFDSNGKLDIEINEEDILNSLGEIKLTDEEKEEIKRQVEEELGFTQTTDQFDKHIKNREFDVRNQLKEAKEQKELINQIRELFEEVKRAQNEQIDLINKKREDIRKQINEIDQNIKKIEGLAKDLGNFDSKNLDSTIEYFNQSEKKLSQAAKSNENELLAGIQQICSLFVHINSWLVKLGQPPMEEIDISNKSMEEIRNLLNEMTDKIKNATKNIHPKS